MASLLLFQMHRLAGQAAESGTHTAAQDGYSVLLLVGMWCIWLMGAMMTLPSHEDQAEPALVPLPQEPALKRAA
jgi:hypothetical protein